MTRWALALAAMVLLAGGCEEERRARVSILPGDAETTAAGPVGPLEVSTDGHAVLLGSDTLFTAERLPGNGPEGVVHPVRFERLAFSPDSTLVAFITAGGDPAVGIWSRTSQTGRFVDVFRGGHADSLAWAPDGRWIAWEGRTSEGIHRLAVSDRAGRRLRHPVLEWLLRRGRSTRLAGWIGRGACRYWSPMAVTGKAAPTCGTSAEATSPSRSTSSR